MKTPELTGAQRDERDEAFRCEMRAIGPHTGGFSKEALAAQVEKGRQLRVLWVKYFPHMRESFNSIPELEKV